MRKTSEVADKEYALCGCCSEVFEDDVPLDRIIYCPLCRQQLERRSESYAMSEPGCYHEEEQKTK